MEAARSAAEVDAVTQLQRQLRDLASDGRPADASRAPLRGVRFTDYHYEPDRSNPSVVYVRAVVDRGQP